jgi:prophage tail gpP-like protein
VSEIVYKINGTAFERWESIHVFKSMNSISGAFGIITNDFAPGNAAEWNVKMGDECIVEIDDQKIITGYIDEFPIEYDENEHFVQILGRDKTADLIDCSYDNTTNEWKNQTIQSIITNLCASFEISVVVDPSVSNVVSTIIESFKADEGEFVSEIILRLCNDNAILPITYGEGKLNLTTARTNKTMADTIELGVNVKRGFLIQNDKNRYSSYKIKGQGIGNDEKQLSDFISPVGTSLDTVVARTKPIVIFSETPVTIAQCINKSKWENRRRAGKSRAVKYVIEGWTQSNGKIWEINSFVRVRDPFLGIDETMIITDIDYFTDGEESGEITNITVVNRTSYDINSTERIALGFDND